MGNIFKTLGIDDLVRSIPGVGGGAANFLNNIDMGQNIKADGSKGTGTFDQFLGGLFSGFGDIVKSVIQPKTDNPNRISNEDYQHNQNLLDSSNPREAARQNEFNSLTNDTNIQNEGAFLQGIAPAQANAHNQFQEQTYQQDTERQVGRIQDMSTRLGMSPWEITGSGGATSTLPSTAAPAQRPQQTRSDGSQFLGSLTPLAVAKMNNDTSLKTAEMQNSTARYIADQQTNKGQLPQAQQAQTAAQTILTAAQTTQSGAQTRNIEQQTKTGIAQESLTWSQAAAAENSMVLNAITTLMQLLPTTEINLGAYKTTEKQGYGAIMDLAKSLGNAANLPQAVGQAIKKMPPKQWSELEKDIIKMSLLITKGARGGMSFINDTSRFLSKLGK